MTGPQPIGTVEDPQGTVDLPRALGGHRFGQDQSNS